MENDATHTSEVSKYQVINQPKIDKFQLQCYSKCLKVTATRFHEATQTFAPLINSVVDDTLLQNGPLGESVICYEATCVRCPST